MNTTRMTPPRFAAMLLVVFAACVVHPATAAPLLDEPI